MIDDLFAALESLPQRTPIRARLIEQCVDALKRADVESTAEPALLLDMAHVHNRLGMILGNPRMASGGEWERALAEHRHALQLIERAAGDPELESRRQRLLGETHVLIAEIARVQGDTAEAVNWAWRLTHSWRCPTE